MAFQWFPLSRYVDFLPKILLWRTPPSLKFHNRNNITVHTIRFEIIGYLTEKIHYLHLFTDIVRDVIGVKIDNCRNEIVTDNDTTNRFPISSIFTEKCTNRLQGQSENKFDSSLNVFFFKFFDPTRLSNL